MVSWNESSTCKAWEYWGNYSAMTDFTLFGIEHLEPYICVGSGCSHSWLSSVHIVRPLTSSFIVCHGYMLPLLDMVFGMSVFKNIRSIYIPHFSKIWSSEGVQQPIRHPEKGTFKLPQRHEKYVYKNSDRKEAGEWKHRHSEHHADAILSGWKARTAVGRWGDMPVVPEWQWVFDSTTYCKGDLKLIYHVEI